MVPSSLSSFILDDKSLSLVIRDARDNGRKALIKIKGTLFVKRKAETLERTWGSYTRRKINCLGSKRIISEF